MRPPFPRSDSRPRLSRLAVGPALLAAVVSSTAPLAATDPFYADQMRRGQRLYQAGEYDTAARSLRIAAFGLLDEPQTLTETLVLLALAEAALGRNADFTATFERIVAIDERFGTYDAVRDSELRTAFEERLRLLIPLERLHSTATFATLAARLEEQRYLALTPRERRQRLKRQLDSEPESVVALRALAELDLEERRLRSATKLVDRALAVEPDDLETHCLRVRVAASREDCRRISESLPRCPLPPASEAAAAVAISCLADAGQWQNAESLLARLSEPLRETPRIAAIAQEVASHLTAETTDDGVSTDAQAAAIASAAAESYDSTETEPLQPGAADPEAAETARNVATRRDPTELARLRAAMNRARQPEELDAPRTRAAELATAHPYWREAQYLAAEIAYRGGQWQEAVEYFERGGAPGTEEPLLLFYYAVALFESGRVREARGALEAALPLISRSSFVDAYARRILETAD